MRQHVEVFEIRATLLLGGQQEHQARSHVTAVVNANSATNIKFSLGCCVPHGRSWAYRGFNSRYLRESPNG